LEKTKKAHVIAFANQKGGVGKTMSVLNIGVGLVQHGYRVLLVDIDAQANLTMGLGFDPDELENTISALFRKIIEVPNFLQSESIDDYILSSAEGVDLLASDMRLSGSEAIMQSVSVGREQFLTEILSCVKEKYDFVLIDCPPSLGILTINSLVAADEVIIPSQAQIFSFKGSELLIQNIEAVRRINRTLKYGGIILTMVNSRSKDAQAVIKETENAYGKYMKIFADRVPISVRASESNRMCKSIYEYDSNGKIAEAYRGIVEEIIYAWKEQ